MATLEKLFDRYERQKNQLKDKTKTVEAIVFHRNIVTHIINEPYNKVILDIGTEAVELSDDIWNKVEFLILLNSLLKIYLGSSFKSISEYHKRRICVILYNIYNSEYKITDKESALLDLTLGLTENENKNESIVEPKKTNITNKNKSNESKLSNLKIGDTVYRFFGDKLSVKGVIKGFDNKRRIICEYICGGEIFTNLFDPKDGRLVDEEGKKIESGYITL